MDLTETILLQNTENLVKICPELGGTIARFTWRGHDILRPAAEAAIAERLVRQMGCYPLVPYSNRIGEANLFADGQQFRLRANAPPEAHALHGFGWQRAWQQTSGFADSATLELKHAADADWPFACEVKQNFQLTGGALHLRLTVRNTDDRTMSAGLGFHPYFPITPLTTLTARWQGMWKMGPDMLPTEFVAAPDETDFSRARVVDGWKVDNCFTGWDRRAVLDYGTHRVQIDADAACNTLVCFAPNDGRNFIAIEPVTNVNNAFALAASGVAETGTVLLAPGEALTLSVTIAVSKL